MAQDASPPLVFALAGSEAFARHVAARLGTPLAAHEERDFEDGEHKARPLVSVRGRDAYVIHSLHGDAARSVNDKLVRLLVFLGALRDASAARVTAVVPYLAYARKDQKSKARDPVTSRYVASFFESVGTDAVVTLDVHNLAAFQNAFRCRSENLEAAGLLAAGCAALVGAAPAVVVSPDAGGIKRADRFRARLARRLGREVGMAFAEKYRSGGELRGEALVGDVEGRVAVIVDDLVSGGRTLERAARACARHGAARVIAAASHGLFAGEAPAVLGSAPIERILVTDSVASAALADPRLAARVEVVPVSGLFAEAIARLHSGGSLEELREA